MIPRPYEAAKRVFYWFFPSGHTSAYIRTLYLKSALRGVRFRRALDAGCGKGVFTLFLARTHPEARFTGYDISPESVEHARKEAREEGLDNVVFEVRDLRGVSDESAYDLVVSLECLEHIPDNRTVFGNLARAVAPGGHLFIMMPCEKTHRWLFPADWFRPYRQWSDAEHVGDQYTAEELAEILRGLGLELLRVRPTFGFWGKFAWEMSLLIESRRWLRRILLPFLFCIAGLDLVWPWGWGAPYGVLALGRKPPASP